MEDDVPQGVLYRMLWNTLDSFGLSSLLGLWPSVPVSGTKNIMSSTRPLSTFLLAKTLGLSSVLTMSHGTSKPVVFPCAQLGSAGEFDASWGSPLTHEERSWWTYSFLFLFLMDCCKEQSFIRCLMRQPQEIEQFVLNPWALAGWEHLWLACSPSGPHSDPRASAPQTVFLGERAALFLLLQALLSEGKKAKRNLYYHCHQKRPF